MSTRDEHITENGTFYVYPMEKLLSTKDVAAILQLTKGRIRQLLIAGELKGKRVGRTWIIKRRDVEDFQKRRL